jgi:hypothetical protein
MRWVVGGWWRPGSVGRGAVVGVLGALALLLAFGPAAGAVARQVRGAASPATGHAAVIAQGVAPMPRVEVAWRVVEGQARREANAPRAARTLGFVLADEGAVVVTDEDTGRRTHLAPGEAVFAAQDVRQRRASTGDDAVAYYGIELVVADLVADEATIGSADLLFAGDGFRAPGGERDLDLVRDVLEEGESSEIEGGDAPVLVLATDGEVAVEADGDEEILRAGEAAVFVGDLTVEATDEDGATFVAAVIGAEVEPVPTPAAGEGLVYVGAFVCPDGVDPSEDTSTCEPSFDGLDATLTGDPIGGTLTLADASGDQLAAQRQWQGLPLGEYTLTFAGAPAGYEYSLDLPSENAFADQSGTSYRIVLDEATPAGGVNRFFYNL